MGFTRRSFPYAAPLAAAALLAAPLAAQQGTAADSARADSVRRAGMSPAARTIPARPAAVQPVADQARGVDAEIRVALFELLHDRDIPALSRLRTLQAAPMSLADSQRASGALKGREDLLFLLAQSYYRLGLDSAFRAAATPLATTSGAARYADVLKGQLLLDAYRRGDFASARAMARDLEQGEQRGLGQLVAGLASYQAGDHAAARTAFQQAQGTPGPFAGYARYMDALALLRTDTTQTAAAVTALEQVAQGSTGEFADQVRLTAAQVAYEAERYPDAARIAAQVSATGGLGAQALLTHAWARYKSDDVAGAGEAFQRFATTYPQLPERDEARLMAAQALLQQGRTDDAGRLFRQVADSLGAEVTAMQGRTAQTMTEAARALVQARAAGVLFLQETSAGKSVALADAAGSDLSVLGAAVSDSLRGMMTPVPTAPEIISLEDVAQRLATVGAPVEQMVSRRVLYAQASATRARTEYAGRASSLYDADVAVAIARWQVNEQLESQARQLEMLRQLQAMVGSEAQGFDALERQLTMARDSLGRLSAALDAAASSIQQMLATQINTTRMLADENLAALDSVRRGLSGGVSASDQTLLELEARTAQSYRETATLIEQGLTGMLQGHPTFALRDSVRMRGERVGQMLAEARGLVNSTQALLASEITRLQGGDSDKLRSLRSTLASAEARRQQAETIVVAVVERELTARAGELLAGLRRDTEAAAFGSASASFFKTLDADRSAAAAGATSGSATRPTTGAATPPLAATTLPRDK